MLALAIVSLLYIPFSYEIHFSNFAQNVANDAYRLLHYEAPAEHRSEKEQQRTMDKSASYLIALLAPLLGMISDGKELTVPAATFA